MNRNPRLNSARVQSFRIKWLPMWMALGFLVMRAGGFAGEAREFVITKPEPAFVPPQIFLTDRNKTAEEMEELFTKTTQSQLSGKQADAPLEAVRYLREAIERMTSRKLPVIGKADPAGGIVLTTYEQAPPDVRDDPKVQAALKNNGADPYNATEAFYIRTDPDRILIVVNAEDGFNHAVVELMESVGYEVLGLGPNWIHVPDFTKEPLVVSLETTERPGFYFRDLHPASGQAHGVGTLHKQPLPDARDEPVENSRNRWTIGTRMVGRSIPAIPGHSLQMYHRQILERMKALNSTAGFLNKTHLGPVSSRPPAAEDNLDVVWISTDEPAQIPSPHSGPLQVFVSDGKEWLDQSGLRDLIRVKVDLSVPHVREAILEGFIKRSEAHFAKLDKATKPSERPFVFGTDPEDGTFPVHGKEPAESFYDPMWYPEYLKREGIEFGEPYSLNGFKGLEQPLEVWDPLSFTDTIFGFNNWLFSEYDKWVDSLPPDQQVALDGISKKDLVHTGLYSYNYHDVPPNFNLDRRIRVVIAGFPKHRGRGKWAGFRSQIDMARAFQKLLPETPSGNYWLLSIAYHRDKDTADIRGSHLAGQVQQRVRAEYDAGVRSISAETDFNFGRQGLEYYLYSKMLWDPNLSSEDLEEIQDRWLKRSFGGGWENMQKYYHLLAPENQTVNAPNTWAKAISLIDAADRAIDPGREPDAQRRLDDLKQFWYYYYLVDSGQTNPPSDALREFIWKGQMSYMTAMHMVVRRYFKTSRVREVVDKDLSSGPAHYSAEETAEWWAQVRGHWPLVQVTSFANVVLANGKQGRSVDVDDLVSVEEFSGENNEDVALHINAASAQPTYLLNSASRSGEIVGCKIIWAYEPERIEQQDKSVPYGISRWNGERASWEEIVDESMIVAPSRRVHDENSKAWQEAEVRFPAPTAGTYRISLDFGGTFGRLFPRSDHSFGDDPKIGGVFARGFTFSQAMRGSAQGPSYFYIPKGAKTLDLEAWGPLDIQATVVLNTGLPTIGMTSTRSVNITKKGTHTIELASGEDGSIAVLRSNGLCFPHLYSIPMLWAKSPSDLLVPREIAKADGLTILE